MGRRPRRAVLTTLAVASAVVLFPTGAGWAQADIEQVMLSSIDGYELVGERRAASGTLTRDFAGDDGEVQIVGFAVATPPGPGVLFSATPEIDGMEFRDEPSLDLARWLLPAGGEPGGDGLAVLTVATRDHLFTISVWRAEGADVDVAATAVRLAAEQVAVAGAPEVPPEADPPDERDEELRALLPESPPPGYGLDGPSLTLPGFTEADEFGFVDPEVVEFVNDRAAGLTSVWGGSGLTLAAGITKYPYDIFAASDLAAYGDLDRITPPDGAAVPSDAVLFRDPDQPQVGLVFRRGDVLALVLVSWDGAGNQAAATELAVEMADTIDDGLPPGGTAPYEAPSQRSRVAALGLSAAFVVLAVAGANIIARLRARRVRRRWASDDASINWPAPRADGTVVQLDADARTLRRRGAVVAGVQLATITIGVVALSGDFAWVGVAVAAASLVTGLAFTRWWLHREYVLLGPAAPSRAFRVPRLTGVLMGITAFAVLGVGVAYLLKGLRYLVLDPTLAQIRWSQLLGVAPRTVGVVFAVGGVLVTMLGAFLWRIARALGRARVRQVLESDERPPVLYLRSFDDDAVPLPTIASARRPLFELFSLRGADPFEECVAWELESYGPVVAVGRPGGSLASLGAAREHLSNETWHDEIATRMDDAGSIVLAPGETAGLEWELRAIVRGGHLAKTLFVFPPLAPADLGRRWVHTSDVLRAAGAAVGDIPAPPALVHTACLRDDGAVLVTWSNTRDEATYRTAVDRTFELRQPVDALVPVADPAAVPAAVSAAVPNGVPDDAVAMDGHGRDAP